MRRLMMATALAVLALLTACGGPPPHGTVVGKTIEAPHTYQEYDCVWFGKYGCKLMLPFTKTAPEQWFLALQDPKDPSRISTASVTPQQYARYPEGSTYP